MFVCKLCITICVLFLGRLSLSHPILKQNYKFSFIKNFKYNANNIFISNLNFFQHLNQKSTNERLNDYTLEKYSVLYVRGPKKGDSEPFDSIKIGKKLENNSETEDVLDAKKGSELEDLSSEEVSDDLNKDKSSEEGAEDALLSKRMLHSILSLTSSAYTPNFFDIIPILYTIKDEVFNISGHFGPEIKLENKSVSNIRRISGLFINNDKGEVERLLLSIPSSELNRLSQSSKYKTEVEASNAPIQIISLSRGFFAKAYQLVVYPYLSQLSEGVFENKYEGHLGFMDYVKSIYERDGEYKEFDVSQLYRFSFEEFEEVFKDYNVMSKKEFDTGVFSEKMLESISQMLKCIKDLVYFNSCLLLLQQILGRRPNDLEILYSFAPPGKNEEKKEGVSRIDQNVLRNKLVDIINYSEMEINHRIDAFFSSFVEVVIANFKRKLKRDSRYYRMMLKCLPDGIEAMKARMFGLHPRIVNALRKNFILQLFKICYNEVKTSAIRNSLPLHLPLSTMRLARKALKLTRYLENMISAVIYEYKNDPSGYRNVDLVKFVEELEQKNRSRLRIDSKIYQEFLTRTLELERQYEARKGDKTANEYMKSQQQKRLLHQTAAKVLNVTVDRISEAIDAYETKEVSATQKIPMHLRPRRGVIRGDAPLSKYYGDLKEDETYMDDYEQEHQQTAIYKRTLRKLAMEALEDRLSRLLFMSHNELFLEHNPDYEEVISLLKIPRKTADFIVFTATLMCKEYEVWRIKLGLPDYFIPRLTTRLKFDESKRYLSTTAATHPALKEPVYVSDFNEDPSRLILSHKPKKGKRDMYRRMRLIKPNLSSAKDLLMNYKKNYNEYERILQRSPIYDL